MKTSDQSQRCRSGVVIVNFEQIPHCSGVSIVDFEQVNAGWEGHTSITSSFGLNHKLTNPTTTYDNEKRCSTPGILQYFRS